MRISSRQNSSLLVGARFRVAWSNPLIEFCKSYCNLAMLLFNMYDDAEQPRTTTSFFSLFLASPKSFLSLFKIFCIEFIHSIWVVVQADYCRTGLRQRTIVTTSELFKFRTLMTVNQVSYTWFFFELICMFGGVSTGWSLLALTSFFCYVLRRCSMKEIIFLSYPGWDVLLEYKRYLITASLIKLADNSIFIVTYRSV